MISGRASFGRALIYPGRYRPHVKSSANQEPREYNSTTRVLFLSPFRACSIYTCRYITIDASGYRSCKPLSLPLALSLPFSPFCTCTFVGRRSGRRKRKFHSLRVFRVLDSIRLLPPKNYFRFFQSLLSSFSFQKTCNTFFLSRTRNFLEKLEIFLRKGGRGRSSGVRATAAIFANHGCRSCGGSHRTWSSPG